MKKYIKNIMFFVISSLIITLVFSSVVQGSNPVISIDKNLYLTDKAIEKEVFIYNFLNEATEFTLKLNTHPFPSQLLEEKVFLSANEVKKVKYKVYPLSDTLDVTYTGSIEAYFSNNRFIEYFSINQSFNRECDVFLEVLVKSLENNKKNITLLFNNQTEKDSEIIIKDIKGVNDFLEKKIVVEKDSSFSYEIISLVAQKEITVEYVCNNVILKKTKKFKNENPLTGFSTLNMVGDFFNSIYFKIILIILLIVLVLSFATRYLRHVDRK